MQCAASDGSVIELDDAYAPYIEAAEHKLVKREAEKCRHSMGWTLAGRASFVTSADASDQMKLNWDAMMLSLPEDAQYELVNVELMFYRRVTCLFFDVCHAPTASVIHAIHEMTDEQRIEIVEFAQTPPPAAN